MELKHWRGSATTHVTALPFVITAIVGTSRDCTHQIETMKILHLSVHKVTHQLHRRRYVLKTRYLLSGQRNDLLTWNLNIHNCFHKSRPLDLTLSQMSPFKAIYLRLSTNFFLISYLTHALCISCPFTPLLFNRFDNTIMRRCR
jgi:hypothetical protein